MAYTGKLLRLDEVERVREISWEFQVNDTWQFVLNASPQTPRGHSKVYQIK